MDEALAAVIVPSLTKAWRSWGILSGLPLSGCTVLTGRIVTGSNRAVLDESGAKLGDFVRIVFEGLLVLVHDHAATTGFDPDRNNLLIKRIAFNSRFGTGERFNRKGILCFA